MWHHIGLNAKRHFCHFSQQQRSLKISLSNTEKHVKDIRRKTRRKFSSEEKIRITLDGLCGEYSIAERYLRNDWLKKV